MLKRLLIFIFLSLCVPVTAMAQSSGAPQYQVKMLRLAEILGSLHSLSNLCGKAGNEWRDHMETMIEAEKPDATRKARLYGAFNDAYRAFHENYTTCTPAAREAYQRYIKEGAALSKELLNRYGN